MSWSKNISVVVRGNWNVNPHIHTRMHRLAELGLLEDYFLMLLERDLEENPDSIDNDIKKCKDYVLKKLGLSASGSDLMDEIDTLMENSESELYDLIEDYRTEREELYEKHQEDFESIEFSQQEVLNVNEGIGATSQSPTPKRNIARSNNVVKPIPAQPELTDSQKQGAEAFLMRGA